MRVLNASTEKYVDTIDNIAFKVICLVSIYIPFEEFFLRWLPGLIPVALRFVPELILYGLMVVVMGSRFFLGYSFRKTPIDWLIGIFFLATGISIVVNGSSIMGSIVNLRTIWRYLSVFYIAVNINFSKTQLEKFLNELKLIMFIQGIVASVQYFLPASFNQAFFAPKGIEVGDYKVESHASAGTLKVGATAGTFSDSAVLSAFLLIGMCLIVASSYATNHQLTPDMAEVRHWATLAFGIFASKKRAALGILLIIPLIIFHIYKRPKNLAYTIWIYAALVLITVIGVSLIGSQPSFSGAVDREKSISVGSYLLQLFSPDYWKASNEQARGWFIDTIIHAIFSTQSWFGFGPDFEQTQRAIRGTLNTAVDIAKLERDEHVFDDSFWAAFFAYFGIVGIVIYGLLLKKLYNAAKWLARTSDEPVYKILGSTFATLIIVTVMYTFAERIFRLRAFSFYFWLLAGLVINTCHVEMNRLIRKRSSY